jgi:starvation-inducible DNA-binding protein
MTSHPISSNVPALGAHEREQIGNELQSVLVDLIDLSLLGKQLHWTVVGPEFRSLHLQLDELIDAWRDLADTVAERAVAIGHMPNGQAAAVAAASAIDPVEAAPIEDHEVVRVLTYRLGEVSERARTRMDRLGDLDAASQDVVIEVVRALEMQLWMVRAQLRQAT